MKWSLYRQIIGEKKLEMSTRRVELEYEDSFLLTICVFFFLKEE